MRKVVVGLNKIIAPICIVGLLSAGLLAGCGTANRFNTNQYDGKYNVYDYNNGRLGNGVNDLNNRFRSYNYDYSDRTNMNGTTTTNRTNIYGTNTNGLNTTGTNMYNPYYPQNTYDQNFGTTNRFGTTSR